MLIRLIIMVVLVTAIVFVYRKLTRNKSADTPPTTAMKKCAECGIHMPERDALHHGSDFFCSENHKARYLQQHPDDK